MSKFYDRTQSSLHFDEKVLKHTLLKYASGPAFSLTTESKETPRGDMEIMSIVKIVTWLTNI